MDINFALILVILVTVTGIITALDRWVWAPRRYQKAQSTQTSPASMSKIAEYSRSFFPVLLAVLLLRSFLFEPFRIPSGSLEPTLLVGDFVLVNKYKYGLRLPVIDKKFLNVSEPKIGDIAVFRWPPDTNNYIKRVVGLPGDRIKYQDKVLYINGVEMPQKFIEYTVNFDALGREWKIEKREEVINGIKHFIYVKPAVPNDDFEITVAPNQYFMMGDNRDDSADSRYRGGAHENSLVGKAFAVWMSWNGETKGIRWDRIGKVII